MLIPTTYGSHQVRAECVIDNLHEIPHSFHDVCGLKNCL